MTVNPEISILVLSHNQRSQLERCLNSVLQQIITVPYEIIVSDDNSTDGTEDYVRDLRSSERLSQIKNLLGLYFVKCNTDDYDLIRGRRPGWNRLNAYNHARGKYFVNVDGDDFLLGTNLYQSEYEVLEAHPDCAMVQTRTLKLDAGASIDQVYNCFPFSEKLEEGAFFSLEDVLNYGLRGQHQSYMYRRRHQDDMIRILGGRFDDINITYYHLQFGPVLFHDTTGYVWVQYPQSDSHRPPENDKKVAYGLIPLSLALLFQNKRHTFLQYGVKKLWRTVRDTPMYPQLSETSRKRYSLSEAFIYRFYAEDRHGIPSMIRYGFVFILLFLMKRLSLTSKPWTSLLFWGIA